MQQDSKTPVSSVNGHQRSFLRGKAHPLKPVVLVGVGGATAGVIKAVDEALLTHELIKVRMKRPEDKNELSAALAAGTQSTLCGLVGHTVILYRAHPDKPRIVLPRST